MLMKLRNCKQTHSLSKLSTRLFNSLLKKKKKSSKVYVEDIGVIGKISEEADFGGTNKIKYGALKTENRFKTNVENFSLYSYIYSCR